MKLIRYIHVRICLHLTLCCLAAVPQGAPAASVQALSTASEAITAPAATEVTANVGLTAKSLFSYQFMIHT